MSRTGKGIVFADCNAVSPRTSAAMDKAIREAGGRYVDGSIIGGPPRAGYSPRLYVSGPEASILSELDGKGVDVRDLGEEIGRASAIKMCYASVTKGTSALQLAQIAAAEALGLTDELAAELMESQPAVYAAMEKGLLALPSKAFRWIGEMEEIAATFASVGLSPGFHEGAADMYRLLSETPFALRDAGGRRPQQDSASDRRGHSGPAAPTGRKLTRASPNTLLHTRPDCPQRPARRVREARSAYLGYRRFWT